MATDTTNENATATAAAKPATKKAATKKPAAKKPAAKKATPLRERDLKVLTVEAGYAAAALADEALAFARELPAKAVELRTQLGNKVTTESVRTQVKELASDAQDALTADKVKETVNDLASTVTKATKELGHQASTLRAEAPAKLKELRADSLLSDAKGNFATYRSKVTTGLDERVASFEKHFDARVKAGKKVVTEVKSNEQVKNVLDQAKTATEKVKDVVTSVRKSA